MPALVFCQSAPRPDMAATPQRPSFSTNTATTCVGCLELEAGVALDEHRLDSPLLLKVGVRENLEFFAGWSPIVRLSNGDSESGIGDVVLGTRVRFHDGDDQRPALAGQVAIKLPTADEADGIGSGETDISLLAILSQSSGRVSVDANAGFVFAANSGSNSQSSALAILTVGIGLSQKMSGYGELFISHLIDDGQTAGSNLEIAETTAIAALGVGYAISPTLILDSALNFNIANADADIQLLVGLTSAFARIF